MLIRPTTDADLDRILAWPVTEPVGVVPADRYRDEAARHQYRPEWTWIAEDEGRILARAIWWGFGDAATPLVLDCVSASASLPPGGGAGRAAVAARLIAAGQQALRRPAPRFRRAMRSTCRPAGGPTRPRRRRSAGGATRRPAPG